MARVPVIHAFVIHGLCLLPYVHADETAKGELAVRQNEFFQQTILPIFEKRCVGCHNDNDLEGDFSMQSADAFFRGGESGQAVTRGKPGESSLIDYLSGDPPEMPKDAKPLSKKEIHSIRTWIERGAHWPQDLRIANRSSIDQDWWSLKPVGKPELPDTVGNPIDHFIEQKLKQQGLSFSQPASRRDLVRRLFYDLTGLPPSVEEVESFVQSEDPDAYSRLVDRLLASEQYGEKWARHWLDVVQYGETHGYDKDKPRINAWPYRDYVIRAFNSDKNYSRFVREQLAGDILWPETTDGIVATGFIAAGPWDFIGHAEVPETKIDGQVARNLDRDNMVTSTMNTFCSLTVQCARCHNHKLDPVTMQQYYSLQAVFASVDRADRDYDADPAVADKRRMLSKRQREIEKEIASTRATMDGKKTQSIRKLESEIKRLTERIAKGSFPKSALPRSPRMGYHSHVAAKQDTPKWVQVDLGKPKEIDFLVLTGAVEYGFDDFGFPVRFVVEVANRKDFSDARPFADFRNRDFVRPGAQPVVLHSPGEVIARYIRLTATRLWSRRMKGAPRTNDWIFAMGELTVVAEGRTVDIQEVTSLDSIEARPGWGRANLVDHLYGGADLETKLGKKESPSNGYHSHFSGSAETTKWVQLELDSAVVIDELRFLPAYPTDFKETPGFGFPLRFRVELSNDPAFGKSTIVRDQSQQDFPNPLTKPLVVNVANQTSFRFIRFTASRLWNRGDPGGKNHALALGEVMVLSDGKNLAGGAKVTASDSINSGRWHQDFLVDGWTSRLGVDQGIQYLAQAGSENELRPQLTERIAERERLIKKAVGERLLSRLAELEEQLSAITSRQKGLPGASRVYAGTVHNGKGAFRGRAGLGPREIHVLHRGDIRQRREKVSPGTVPFIKGVASMFSLPDAGDEGSRRVALADWIVRPDNPLTWRSVVNRVWQYHFGKGIVDTPNDFGRGGSKPTHPQLLEWLAVEFRDGGRYLEAQSFKSLHRMICNSRTYQQSSRSAEFVKQDNNNRFLWKMDRRRLSAEEIHDTVLKVAGLLDPKMGGPSYRDFVIQRPEHSPHYEYHLYDPNDRATHRRAVYRFIVRSQPQPFLDTLNCADPSSSVPKRVETLTALQALGMLNNLFMVAMSEQYAALLEKESGRLPDQLRSGYRKLTGRTPDDQELILLQEYAEKHGLKNLCRVYFNLSEFVFVD
ncbi:MAG: DUF1553 domain-containing protein [Planctomycetota bacterium]|nr:DUF1553 domain-containing protein [Planctomycetota bacterium]